MEEPLRHSIPKTPAPARGWRFAKELIAWASYLRRHGHKDTCVYLCASAPLRGGSKSFTFLLHWLESRCFEPASFHSSLFIANHRSFYYSPYKNNKRNVIFFTPKQCTTLRKKNSGSCNAAHGDLGRWK